MAKPIRVSQILVVTDGCSNVGSDPIVVAKEAKRQGIIVSVIGIVDADSKGAAGRDEAQAIAKAGGGLCRFVEVTDLSMTMQMVTRQTTQLTLHQAVNEELRQLIGKETAMMPPEQRQEVVSFIDDLAEEASLSLSLLIDVSASMTSKMNDVVASVRELSIGLEARKGQFHLRVFTFPDGGSRQYAKELILSHHEESLSELIGRIKPAGNTPTGPALSETVVAMLAYRDDAPRRDSVV
nr:VWA domain-containing protein [Bacilli bacterium]